MEIIRDYALGFFMILWGLCGCLVLVYTVDGNFPLAASNVIKMLLYAVTIQKINITL